MSQSNESARESARESDTQTESNSSKKKGKRARLGRGLGALIDSGNLPQVAIELETSRNDASGRNTVQNNNEIHKFDTDHGSDSTQQIMEISIDRIVPNPHQPRRVFDEEALSALAASIALHGLMQPVVVRVSNGPEGGYELVAGERRLRACKLAGRETIRAILSDANEGQSAQLALIENIQRADLNPIERAMGFSQLINRFGLTQQQLADRVGLSRPVVANLMRLLELDDELLDLIASGSLSTGHGKVLLSCEDQARRKRLGLQCVSEGWTVRLLESHVAKGGGVQGYSPSNIEDPHQSGPHTQSRVDSVLQDLERRLSEQLGTRVTLTTNAKGSKGRIQIEFYDLDQFDGLLMRLGIAGESEMI